jgi:hypothetical protein
VEGRGVAGELHLQLELTAGDHHRHPVVADRAGDEHPVAGLDRGGGERKVVLDHPDPRGVDVEPVGLAALDHLGVAGGDRDARRLGGGAHRRAAERC